MTMEKKMTGWNLGIFFVVCSSLLHSIGGLCMKVIPWNGMSINGGRNIIAAVVIFVFMMVIKHPPRLNLSIAFGALCVTSTQILFSLANKMTTAANVIVLQFTTPIFVILLSLLLFKRKPKRLDVVACAVVLSGVVCFFIDGLEMGGMLGNMLALTSGVTNAMVYLVKDLPGGDQLSSLFWGDLLSALIGLPFLLQETEFTPVAITSILALGALNVALAHILFSYGIKTTPAVTASLISGIEPILNPILVAVFYGETVGSMALVGATIVVVSVVGYNVLKARSPEYHVAAAAADPGELKDPGDTEQ